MNFFLANQERSSGTVVQYEPQNKVPTQTAWVPWVASLFRLFPPLFSLLFQPQVAWVPRVTQKQGVFFILRGVSIAISAGSAGFDGLRRDFKEEAGKGDFTGANGENGERTGHTCYEKKKRERGKVWDGNDSTELAEIMPSLPCNSSSDLRGFTAERGLVVSVRPGRAVERRNEFTS